MNNEPYWELMYMGLEPQYQGKKLGVHLNDIVLEWADQDNRKCATHTFNERNLDFFRKLGFEIVDKFRILNAPSSLH